MEDELDTLVEAQEQSGASMDDGDDVIRIQVDHDQDLSEAVFELEQGLAQKEEGERLEKTAKQVLSNHARKILAEHNGKEGTIPKKFGFVSKTYTAWINTRPNGYGKFTKGMVDDLAKIDASISKHLTRETSVSTKWGSIPEDKRARAVEIMMELNYLVYGKEWKASSKQPSLVVVERVHKARTDSFYTNQFTIQKDAMQKLQELQPIRFALSSTNGRKK